MNASWKSYNSPTWKLVFPTVKHSLKFFLVTFSGPSDKTKQKFVGFGVIDGSPGAYCNNDIVPQLEWARNIAKDYHELQNQKTQECSNLELILKATAENLRKQLNQTEGMLLLNCLTMVCFQTKSRNIQFYSSTVLFSRRF